MRLLVFAAEEDFGLVLVEAQPCGRRSSLTAKERRSGRGHSERGEDGRSEQLQRILDGPSEDFARRTRRRKHVQTAYA